MTQIRMLTQCVAGMRMVSVVMLEIVIGAGTGMRGNNRVTPVRVTGGGQGSRAESLPHPRQQEQGQQGRSNALSG